MNFTFMIYIILAIMIFMSINKKVKLSCIYFCVPLFIILLLNEIYNFGEYVNIDNFTAPDTWNKYKFNKDFNPYDYYDDFKGVIIPFNNDPDLEAGMRCKPQSNILQNQVLKKKLMLQDSYSNQILDVIAGKPFDESISKDVFLPIRDDMIEEKKECPTVCHLIKDKNKCDAVRNVPKFKNEDDFDDWNEQLDKCKNITTSVEYPKCSDVDDKCIYDDDANNCYSKENLKKCFSFQKYGDTRKRIIKDYNPKYNGMEVTIVPTDNPIQSAVIKNVLLDDGTILKVPNTNLIQEAECYTKCNFLTDPNNNEKQTEINCNSAITSDGKKYCRLTETAGEKTCAPACHTFEREDDCPVTNGCKFEDNKCKDDA